MRSLRNVLSFVLGLLAAAPALAQCDPVEEQKLLASDGALFDRFGNSASISGDTALVGAWGDDDNGSASGAVYIFERIAGTWVEAVKLLAADGAASDWFGWSVAISGDTAIVGAPQDDDLGPDSGSAYIFERAGNAWMQTAKLLANDGDSYDRFGSSVSISGDTVIVGAHREGAAGAGAAYIFEKVGNDWVEVAKLVANQRFVWEEFGWSVSIYDDVAIVGGARVNVGGSGSAFIFTKVGGIWMQTAKLHGDGDSTDDLFGYSVSISGDTAMVGSPGDDEQRLNTGSTYIFEKIGDAWVRTGKLLASNGSSYAQFGISVSISGGTALVGSYDDRGFDSGSAYQFVNVNGKWMEIAKLLASDGAAGDWFGGSLSVSGDRALVGARGDNDLGRDSGSAYIFNLTCSCPADLDADGDADVNDFFLFLDLFAAGDPRADITGDGSIDVNDFFAYLDLFAAGCD